MITGDGDGLSIGGNHLIHALRRNMDLKIILFNNQIYGLTKGQYSPTSRVGTRAPSTPTGSIDHPLNPISLALGAGATFIARAADTDAKLMGKILERGLQAQGRRRSSRCCRTARSSTTACGKASRTTRRAARSCSSTASRSCSPAAPRASSSAPVSCPRSSTSATATPSRAARPQRARLDALRAPARAARAAGLPDADGRAATATTSRPTTSSRTARSQEAIEKQGPGDLNKLMYSGMVWEVGADGTRH